jgi:hypothetical protein
MMNHTAVNHKTLWVLPRSQALLGSVQSSLEKRQRTFPNGVWEREVIRWRKAKADLPKTDKSFQLSTIHNLLFTVYRFVGLCFSGHNALCPYKSILKYLPGFFSTIHNLLFTILIAL